MRPAGHRTAAESGAVPLPNEAPQCFRERGPHLGKFALARWAWRPTGSRNQTAEAAAVLGRGKEVAGGPRLVQPYFVQRCLVQRCLVQRLTRGCSPLWCWSRCCQAGIVSAWLQAKFGMPSGRCSEPTSEPMRCRIRSRPGREVRVVPERRLRRMGMRCLRPRRAIAQSQPTGLRVGQLQLARCRRV